MNEKKGLEITAVGLPVLKRDDLVNYLNNDKIVSKDTKSVAGVDSNNIAISADGYDRNTVENALNLGGIDYNEFLQKDEVGSLFKFAKEVSITHMNEIRNLKDELYQTKSDLVRLGHLRDDSLHHGVVDTFNELTVKYNQKSYDILNTIIDNTHKIIIDESLIEDFVIGEKIAIITETKEENEDNLGDSELNKEESTDVAADINSIVYTIKEIGEDHLITEEPLISIDNDNSKIYKTSGEYKNGSFVYAKPTQNVTTGKERKTTFLDDINIRKRSLFRRGDGFAVRFKIDKILNGALKDFSIKAEKIGNPGGLECFIIHEKDMDKFNNIEEVIKEDKKNKIIIARSSNHVEDGKGLLKFSFRDASGRYPLINVNNRDRHCAIIVSNSQNESDDKSGRWEISFSASNPEGTDLYLHNNTYRFKNRVAHDLSPLSKGIFVDPDLENLELNYILTSIETADEGYEPFTEGIYTINYRLPLNNNSTNLRIAMKGNKDSDFIVKSEIIIENKSTETIIIEPRKTGFFTGSKLTNQDFKVDIGDTVIIGETPFIVKEGVKGNGQIKVKPLNNNQDYVKINNGDPIFRCDYEVFVKGYNMVKTTDNNGDIIEKEEDVIIKQVPLTGSINELFYNSDSSTNKMIFETDFILEDQEEPMELTNFEIVILWRSKYSKNEIKNAIGEGFFGLIGRIDDLAISFNKSIYAENITHKEKEEEQDLISNITKQFSSKEEALKTLNSVMEILKQQ